MGGIESRKYRILGVLGQGGFGTVYRARLEGEAGFVKEVALKLLTSDEVSEDTLARFRDEARILGLVRDRAIVSVDSPTRINGKWAVVMEFVDGASCTRLGKQNGVFPPGVAVEIVGEVARALDKVYNQAGPDGAPLKLLHRDIKPANIQVTPSGEVKVLDFGIARAEFENREAATTTHIGGTPGYIAPERLYGEEGPSGDIYSLGVVLHVLLTAKRPPPHWTIVSSEEDTVGDITTGTPGLRQAMLLAKEMVNADPRKRPAARAVEEECHRLRGECRDDPRLRLWAESVIPTLSEMEPDDLVGTLITETLRAVPLAPDDLAPDPTVETKILRIAGQGALVAAGGTSILMIGIGVGVAAVALMAGLYIGFPGEAPEADPSPTATVAEVVPEPKVAEPTEPSEEPAPDAAAPEPTKSMAEPIAKPTQPPAVAKTEPIKASPAPVAAKTPEPVAAPPPSAKTKAITFTSIPMDAEVWIDGKKVGTTPLPGFALSEGSHSVKMVLDGKVIEKSIRVGRRSPVRHVWKAGENKWESGL